jgi:hypothetical protein
VIALATRKRGDFRECRGRTAYRALTFCNVAEYRPKSRTATTTATLAAIGPWAGASATKSNATSGIRWECGRRQTRIGSADMLRTPEALFPLIQSRGSLKPEVPRLPRAHRIPGRDWLSAPYCRAPGVPRPCFYNCLRPWPRSNGARPITAGPRSIFMRSGSNNLAFCALQQSMEIIPFRTSESRSKICWMLHTAFLKTKKWTVLSQKLFPPR